MAPKPSLTPVQVTTLLAVRRTGLHLVGGRWRIKGARAAASNQTIDALVAKGCLVIAEDTAVLTELGREALEASGSRK
jgi:hypothetical protein